MKKVKILAFSGSTRRDSLNKMLVRNAMKGAQNAGAEVTYVDLKDYQMPLYDSDLEQEEGIPENVKNLKTLMKEHDGFLIASPEYNSGMSGVLKNAIDWTSRPEEGESMLACYRGKTAAIMSASPGGLGGLRGLYHLRYVLENIGVLVLPDQIAVGKAYEAFDDDGLLKDAKWNEQIEALGSKLVETVSKLKG